VSIITISVSGPVTYIDLYRPSLRRQGQKNMGQGYPQWPLRWVLWYAKLSWCRLPGLSPVIISYGMSLTPLLWAIVERARTVTLNMLVARQRLVATTPRYVEASLFLFRLKFQIVHTFWVPFTFYQGELRAQAIIVIGYFHW